MSPLFSNPRTYIRPNHVDTTRAATFVPHQNLGERVHSVVTTHLLDMQSVESGIMVFNFFQRVILSLSTSLKRLRCHEVVLLFPWDQSVLRHSPSDEPEVATRNPCNDVQQFHYVHYMMDTGYWCSSVHVYTLWTCTLPKILEYVLEYGIYIWFR